MIDALKPATDTHLPLISIDDHAQVDLSGYNAPEDWLALGLFWLMCAVVFLQFFTRYVLNDSFAWTEEIARYVLIAVIYVGTAMCVRRNRHIHVDFIYRLVPAFAGRVLSTFVDVLRIVFFIYATWMTWKLMAIVGSDKMTMIKLPMNVIYYFVLGGLAMSAIRSVQVTIDNWRQGYSILENPEAYMDEGGTI
jgi:TRAP-type C4-dicarboxylate transport system permease small subunit